MAGVTAHNRRYQVRRDDGRKLSPCGLTRLTRHPLILPVVPWGCANALLAGGHAPDLALFGGLALYAVAGCYAQDLRAQASAQVGALGRLRPPLPGRAR